MGRELLVERLEIRNGDVHTAFGRATGKLKDGETLSRRDIVAMREALEDARRLVEVAAVAAEGVEPERAFSEYLTDQEWNRVAQRIKTGDIPKRGDSGRPD